MRIFTKLNEELRVFKQEELDLDAITDAASQDDNYNDEEVDGDDFFNQDGNVEDLNYNLDDVDMEQDDDTFFNQEDDSDDFFSQGDDNYSEDTMSDLPYDFDQEDADLALDGEDVGEVSPEDDMGMMDEPAEEDPNFQGMIRTVKGANLVFKRQNSEGTFDELWIYNIGKDIEKESQIRRAVLADTDINPSNEESEDGTQRTESYSVGNVNFIHITGLPS